MKFSVIIPNYNSEKWIDKLLYSILEQTYIEYEVIIVDDMSTDNSITKIKEYEDSRIKLIELKQKGWNGGTRNIGVENAKGEYILFADCDDWFIDNKCFEKIAKIIDRDKPDCVRLPYRFVFDKYQQDMMLSESTPQELVKSIFVAPWTKCIKRELFAPFPENTLLEDVAQHIAQVDKIETISVCEEPIICWNRNNKEAVSAPGNAIKYNNKRISSVFRNVADLMDLQCEHSYCEEHRKWRLNNYLAIVRKGKEVNI